MVVLTPLTDGTARIFVLGLGHTVGFLLGAGWLALRLVRQRGIALWPRSLPAVTALASVLAGLAWVGADAWAPDGRLATMLCLVVVGGLAAAALLRRRAPLPPPARAGLEPGGAGAVKKLLAAALGLLAFGTLLPASPAAADEPVPVVDRVLIFSMPTLSWEDANELDLPNLSAFLDESAIAGLSTRAVDRRTTAGDGYTTLNAGTRADGDDEFDGLAFEADERYLGEPRRARSSPGARASGWTRAWSASACSALDDANDDLDFGAEVGALGDALREGGAHAAVIAQRRRQPRGACRRRSPVRR